MIYGRFSIGEGHAHDLLKRFEMLHFFDESLQEKIDFYDFRGGIILSNRLPLTPGDFYYKNEAEGIFILFSGFIYNQQELRLNYNLLSSTNNAALIYKLFRLLGPDFVKTLNGDFSIIIYQPQIKEVLLYRDHLGVEPLAYFSDKNALWFSSNIYSLSKAFYSDANYDPEPFLDIFRMIDYKALPVKTIKKVLPAHYIMIKDGKVKSQKYWHPERIRTDNKLDKVSFINGINDLLTNAVGRRCDPLFNAGAHVSGGLDCGVVSALARKQYSLQNPFYGFSWSPEQDDVETGDFDERKLVREHCKSNNINPVFSSYGRQDCLRYSENPVNQFYHELKVQEEAVKRKVNLLFSGYGGDEFLSKGDRGIDTDLILELELKSFFTRNPPSNPRKLLKTLYFNIILPFINILDPSVRKAQKEAIGFLKEPFRTSNRANIKRFYFYKSRRQLHLGFLYCYYLPVRMEQWHISGQRAGIVYRYPLLDKDIVEYILKVPSRLMFSGRYSRIILREIGKDILPESVRWRTRGSDPATEKWAKEVAKECYAELVDQVEVFKGNNALRFLDFDALERALKTGTSTICGMHIPALLVWIKFHHELTKWYRSE